MLKMDDAMQSAIADVKNGEEADRRQAAVVPIPAGGVFLLFVIDAGRIEWRAAYNTRDEAVAELNGLRPDGTSSIHEVKDAPNDGEVFTSDDCIEFAFLVESPHFVSFV